MPTSLQLDELSLTVDTEAHPLPEGYLLRGQRFTLTLPFTPTTFYRHGWHSWSLSAWLPSETNLHAPFPALHAPQIDDPLYLQDEGLWSAWLGAVPTPDGRVLLLGALDLDTRIRLEGDHLIAWCESGNARWLLTLAADEHRAFAAYANHLARLFGRRGLSPAPRVWCSWYSFETQIAAPLLEQTLASLADFPFEVFQIDDGWQQDIGDWEANERFPEGMAALAQAIRAAGRTPGLWWAPFLVRATSRLYREHPDWLLRDESNQPVSAGHNWGTPIYALDTTHPEVQGWLLDTLRRLRSWGFDYLKLDFLYAAALPGRRHQPIGREAALRQALQLLRQAAGDAYLLLCGVPILPALGLADGLRIGPDTAPYWDNFYITLYGRNFASPGVLNALRTTLHRLWLRPLTHTDPDVAFFRSRFSLLTPEQRQVTVDLAHIAGFHATSDPPFWLDPPEQEALRRFWAQPAPVERLGRYRFRIDNREVDFTPWMTLPHP